MYRDGVIEYDEVHSDMGGRWSGLMTPALRLIDVEWIDAKVFGNSLGRFQPDAPYRKLWWADDWAHSLAGDCPTSLPSVLGGGFSSSIAGFHPLRFRGLTLRPVLASLLPTNAAPPLAKDQGVYRNRARRSAALMAALHHAVGLQPGY